MLGEIPTITALVALNSISSFMIMRLHDNDDDNDDNDNEPPPPPPPASFVFLRVSTSFDQKVNTK